MNDEILALVDRNDSPVGTIYRSQLETLMDPERQQYLRTACALICNDSGEYWTPRRLSTKKIAPNGLDFAMAEHMGPDETYLEAAVRGFDEELNLHIQPSDLALLGILGPRLALHLPYFSAIYVYKSNEVPGYNPDDFSGGEWLKPERIVDLITDGEPAKTLLVPAVKLALLQEGRL